MRANDGDDGSRGVTDVVIASPLLREPGNAGSENEEGQRNEENPEAKMRTRGIPVDDLLGGMRGLELGGLNAAEEERRYEENGGEDECEFQCGEGAVEDLHGAYFASQSIDCQIEILGREG